MNRIRCLKSFWSVFFVVVFSSRICIGLEEWQEAKGDHFIVYFNDDKKSASEVLFKAEKYYTNIASELGYQRYSTFWTWENRAKIYIYKEKEYFLKATNQPAWSEGMADYNNRSISSYAWSQGFIDAILPHEIAHLIFRDYVGFKGEIPLWLDEGVAQWMEPRKREEVMIAVKDLADKNKLIPVEKMLSTDIRGVSDEDLVRTFYIEAMSLVGFLITKYGSESFTNFCRQLRDGKSFKEALIFTYPTTIRDTKVFQEKWLKYIEEN